MKQLVFFLLLTTTAWAQFRPVHTFSIVARDPQTGELGVAVQSHWFAVGPTVPSAEAGVGAVATQSFADPSYGKLGLDLMRAGRSAPDALRGLLHADKSCEVRQVAMIDINGNVASFTGAKNIFEMGSAVGYSTIWWARAVGKDGRVVYTDGDRKNADEARGYFQRAGVRIRQ